MSCLRECIVLFLPPGTGFDQSARRLAAFYYMPPPAAGQVVCWRRTLPLPEAAARRATEQRAGVPNRHPHEKRLRKNTYSDGRHLTFIRPAVEEPADRLLLSLPTPRTAEY